MPKVQSTGKLNASYEYYEANKSMQVLNKTNDFQCSTLTSRGTTSYVYSAPFQIATAVSST